jgi:hypothetical protein
MKRLHSVVEQIVSWHARVRQDQDYFKRPLDICQNLLRLVLKAAATDTQQTNPAPLWFAGACAIL